MQITLQVCVLKDIFSSYPIILKNIASIISRKMRKVRGLNYGYTVNTGYIKVLFFEHEMKFNIEKGL